MTFTVYAELAPEVSKKLDKLAAKAAAYGVPFRYTASEEHPQAVNVVNVDSVTQTQFVLHSYTVAAVTFQVECEELIKANGWTVCAKIEHGREGNIVTGFGSYKMKPEWYTAAPNCDHCHTKRPRSVTYFVEHEDGSIRQIGRTCLKEYTGISPATAAMWAEVQDIMDRGMDRTLDEWETNRSTLMYSVLNILAHACDVVKEFGYRKSSEPDSTREKVAALVASGKHPTDAGLSEAHQIIDWLTTVNPENASDLERNCISLVKANYAKRNHIGYLAYMPVAFRRCQERKAQQEAAAGSSAYVGAVGQRITMKIQTVALLSSWDNYYGRHAYNLRTTWLYKFVDESGNVYIWYASQPCEAASGATIRATVKEHKERDGVKQTIITRCRVVASEPDPQDNLEPVSVPSAASPEEDKETSEMSLPVPEKSASDDIPASAEPICRKNTAYVNSTGGKAKKSITRSVAHPQADYKGKIKFSISHLETFFSQQKISLHRNAKANFRSIENGSCFYLTAIFPFDSLSVWSENINSTQTIPLENGRSQKPEMPISRAPPPPIQGSRVSYGAGFDDKGENIYGSK